MRLGRRSARMWTKEDGVKLADLYDVDKLGPTAIAERFGVSVSSARAALLKFRALGVVKTCRGGGGGGRKKGPRTGGPGVPR